MLGLQCRVGHVSVAMEDLCWDTNTRMLATVLADVRPTTLSLRLLVSKIEAFSLRDCLIPTKETLTRIALFLNYSGERSEDSTKSYLVSSRLCSHLALLG